MNESLFCQLPLLPDLLHTPFIISLISMAAATENMGGGHMPTHPCREAMPDQSHAVPDGWKLGFLAQEPRSCARASLSGGALLSIRVVHYVHVRHQKKSLLGSAPAESNCLDQGLSGPITQ